MARGTGIDFPDLIIGTTALHLGFGAVTLNAKHFQAIPGFSVVQLQLSYWPTGPARSRRQVAVALKFLICNCSLRADDRILSTSRWSGGQGI